MQKYKIHLLLIFYFLTRLVNLSLLPIFNDEAIYIDWGQNMLSSGKLFFSLADGKQPLLMWIFGIFAKVFPDPLFGARLVSVIFGALSLYGIFKITKKYFGENTAFLASIIYILSPIFLFFNRQALMESAITTLGIWSYLFLINYLEKPNYKTVSILGILWGFGLFIKSSFLVFIFISILVLLISGYKQPKKYFPKILLAFLYSFIILIPLVLQPDFGKIIELNNRFSLSFKELLSLPSKIWINNIFSFFDIGFWQTYGLFFTPLLVFLIHNFKEKKNLNLILWFLGGIIIYILTVREANPRYLVTFLPFGIILASKELSCLKKMFRWVFIVITFGWFVIIDFLMLFNPINYFQLLKRVSNYSQNNVYLGSFTSGYGIGEALKYLISEIGNKKAVVGVRLDAGNPENSTSLYLSKFPNIKVIYLDARSVNLSEDKNYLDLNIPIYFVARDNQLAGLEKFLIFKKKFLKPDGISFITVYEVRTKIQN